MFLENTVGRKVYIFRISIKLMPIRSIEFVSNQALFPRPLPIVDASMNSVGAGRAIGIGENGEIGLVVDAYFLRREGMKEFKKWEEMAMKVMRKGAHIQDVIKFFRLEAPEIFDIRRINIGIEDPSIDVVMGTGGIELQALWDYEGNFRSFYRVTPSGAEELNMKLGQFLAITRILPDFQADYERIKIENENLRVMVADLQYSLDSIRKAYADTIGQLGDLIVKLQKTVLESRGKLSDEDVKNLLGSLNKGISELREGLAESIKHVAGTKVVMLKAEEKIVERMNAIRAKVLELYSIPLTPDQLLNIVERVIIERPEWLKTKLEEMGFLRGGE
jgi:hypothetical protein